MRFGDNDVDLPPGARQTIAATDPIDPRTPASVGMGWRSGPTRGEEGKWWR